MHYLWADFMELWISAILIGVGIFLLFLIEKLKGDDTRMYIALFTAIGMIIAGGWLLYTNVPHEILKKRFWGIIITLAGAYLVFEYPQSTDYQPQNFGYTGILIGLILLIAGIYMLFF